MHSTLRCVLIGDACVGKTSLIVAYTTNGFNDRYYPTAFDNYSVTVNVDESPLKLELYDTAGRSEFDTIRPLSYADANVFLLCFNVMRTSSLRSATQRWLPELRHIAPCTPILLVGTQSDQRFGNLRQNDDPPVDATTLRKVAEQCQLECMECSAVTHHNLKEVFDLAILYGLRRKSVPSPTPPQQQPPRPVSSLKRMIGTTKPEKAREEKTKHQPTSFKEGFRRLVTMTRKFL